MRWWHPLWVWRFAAGSGWQCIPTTTTQDGTSPALAACFGSAIAAGRLLGLDTQDLVQAMGIAGTQASGVREVFGSMTKPFHPGRSAQSGVLAALLAQGGFSSSATILEGRRGFGAVAL